MGWKTLEGTQGGIRNFLARRSNSTEVPRRYCGFLVGAVERMDDTDSLCRGLYLPVPHGLTTRRTPAYSDSLLLERQEWRRSWNNNK